VQDISRRSVLAGLAGVSLLTASFSRGSEPFNEPSSEPTNALSTDKERIMAAGLTDKEAETWRLTAETAKAFFELPVLHSMDSHEVASAIHVIQNKLLARPSFREHLKNLSDVKSPEMPVPSSMKEMTAQELRCHTLVLKTAEAFFELNPVHPNDHIEVAVALHTVQSKLLGRPVYRKYLDAASGDSPR
jgi:hypothetical protein